MGSLIDGAHTWRFYIAGCTEARLCMPLRTLNLQTTLRFCQWYRTLNSTPTGFSINSFGVMLISRQLKQKVTERGEGKRVRVPGLGEFIVTADSEVSDAESPRFEGDAGAEVPFDAPSGVGTTPMEHVELEEVKEKDPDVHFKRKRQDESRRKRVVKKPRRYTPTIIAEGESTATPPPPAPLVIKLSAPRQIIDKAVHDLSKISSVLAAYTYIFHIAHCLFYDSGTETARDPRAEAAGE